MYARVCLFSRCKEALIWFPRSHRSHFHCGDGDSLCVSPTKNYMSTQKLNYSCMYWTPQPDQNWPVHSGHAPEFQARASTRIYNSINAFQEERKSVRKQGRGNITVSARARPNKETKFAQILQSRLYSGTSRVAQTGGLAKLTLAQLNCALCVLWMTKPSPC